MKKLIYTALLMLAFTSFVYSQPKLVIEGGDAYNFGNKCRATENPVNTTIKIFNAGTETLKVENPKPLCGCTSAPLDKNLIEPGEYATLGIKLYLNVSHGNYSKTVIINSNDPLTPTRNLTLNAVVFQDSVPTLPIQYSPLYLNFGLMIKNKDADATIELTNTTNENIKIESVSCPKGIDLNISKGDKIKANSKLVVKAEFEPEQSGPFTGNIVITTNNPKLANVNIPVWGFTR